MQINAACLNSMWESGILVKTLYIVHRPVVAYYSIGLQRSSMNYASSENKDKVAYMLASSCSVPLGAS